MERKHPEDTIARYWQDHGYSYEEARRMERDQIAAAMRQEEIDCLYDAGIWNAWEA